jgi:AcrR family transcriptional regulator
VPRPRFAKLPQAQQQAILGAALDEFAAHGFHDASLNRIIDAAGISKGSMYYYFDDKEDLFASVVRVEFERLFSQLGAVALPTEAGPDAFWSAIEAYYLDAMTAMAARPQLAALVRGWLAVSENPALQQAQQGMEQEIRPWVERVLTAGQAGGAVRDDLPHGLLIAIALGMGRAMDMWLMTQEPDDAALPLLISALVGMIRRALQP